MTTPAEEQPVVVAPKGKSVLDPFAPPFRPTYSDRRCLFLTFSNGYPLTERQIYHFFNRLYPRKVDHVYVHKPTEGYKTSLFGKVMFKHILIPDLVMLEKEKVSCYIAGRPLYLRRFVTKNSKTATPSVPEIAAADTASTSSGDGGSDNGGNE